MATERKPSDSETPAIAGYSILEEIGRGGMGVVYKALQLRINRVVALKLVRGNEDVPPDDLIRFLVEGELLAKMQHPNIVQIYEVGKHTLPSGEIRPYMAMEYINGGTLKHQLSGRPHSAKSAARLLITLARAVHYAHQQGIIHRDLKPANVLMSADGTPKITDFGLAKQLRLISDLTDAGFVVGTPDYMAPEQARGKTVGPASDIHALGMLLYELLTGKPPFVGDSDEEIMQLVVRLDPLPPSRIIAQVPRDLETICMKCLEKQPSKRYATAAALAEDLERFLAGQDVAARQLSRVEQVTRWIRRNQVATGLAAAVVFLLTGLVVLFALYLHAEAGLRSSGAPRHVAEQFQRVKVQVDRLAAEQKGNAALLYSLAGILATAAAAADSPEAIDGYSTLALDLLKNAQSAGYFNRPAEIERLKKDTVFDSLRGRAEYQQWLDELEKK